MIRNDRARWISKISGVIKIAIMVGGKLTLSPHHHFFQDGHPYEASSYWPGYMKRKDTTSVP